MKTIKCTSFSCNEAIDLCSPESATIILSDKECALIKKAIECIEDNGFDAVIVSISNWEVENFDDKAELGRILVNKYDCWFRFYGKYSQILFESCLTGLLEDIKYNVFSI